MTTPISITCQSELETQRLAETLALALRPGDLVTLEGNLGAGKTTLARALIRSAVGDETVEVPSPTFTLVQSYEGLPFGKLAHMDLYRIEDPQELDELGLEDALAEGVAIIEWPQKAQGELPKADLHIKIEQGDEDDSRVFILDGNAETRDRVNRSLLIRNFLNANGHTKSTRRHFNGDASARTYEVITPETGADLILMNSPAQPDGPVVRDGKPYSQIAHLAEDVRAFVAVGTMLQDAGFRAPEIYAQDLDEGLLLTEYLGSDVIITANRAPIEARYLVAMETLAQLHETKWVYDVSLQDGSAHRVPEFDRPAMMIEVELLTERYAPYVLDTDLSADQQSAFDKIWNDLITKLQDAEKSLLLRDYHSPNIIWIDHAKGTDRIGIIDFQDAMIGPTAYDVASIAQDARIDIPAALETRLLERYCATRAQLNSGFDEASFRESYAIMAAERVTKVMGIFVRLSERDGKHEYLAHLPRMKDYLSRSLTHPVLAEYRAWVENTLHKDMLG